MVIRCGGSDGEIIAFISVRRTTYIFSIGIFIVRQPALSIIRLVIY